MSNLVMTKDGFLFGEREYTLPLTERENLTFWGSVFETGHGLTWVFRHTNLSESFIRSLLKGQSPDGQPLFEDSEKLDYVLGLISECQSLSEEFRNEFHLPKATESRGARTMELNWKKDINEWLEKDTPGTWRFTADLPNGWGLSVLHRMTGFGFWETETALRQFGGNDEYFRLMAGDIRDRLSGNETFEEIKSIVEVEGRD